MRFRWMTVLVLCALQVSCKKDGDSEGGGANASVPVKLAASTAKQDFPFQYVPTYDIPAQSTFTLSKQPSWMSINATTGVISGTPSDPGTLTAILVTAKGPSGTAMAEFDLSVSGDALAKHQWALENTGQTAFATNAATAGMDLKAKEAHRFGVLGSGVTVLVSDEGVQLAHEDLADNVAAGKSKNYLSADPYFGEPVNTDTSLGNHGTSVAGIIAARGWNGAGVRGVAPEAKIAGTNFLTAVLAPPGTVDQVAIEIDQAADSDAKDAHYDVFNYSYGYGGTLLVPISETLLNQLIHGVTTHRSGKGSVYVKSSGNSYQTPVLGVDNKGNPVFSGGQRVFTFKQLSSEHEEDNTIPYEIVVGALNAKGLHASYSSSGANLLVSAPGGEDGSSQPAIVTTDESACTNGYARSTTSGSLVTTTGGAKNTGCAYTSIFNGTSSAAPHVSGTVALMLSVNPNLTWRDVKHLLVTTAVQTDPSQLPLTSSISGTPFVIEDAWVQNAAGYKFNPLYGFGRVDANAAVRAASAYTAYLPIMKQTVTPSGNCPETEFCADDTWLFSNTTAQTVNDNNATGVTSTINVTANLKVEAIQIRVNIEAVRNGDIGIRLMSPSGTSVNVLNPQTAMFDTNFVDQVFLSNAYYGENSTGIWSLKVFDSQPFTIYKGANGNGRLVNWSINVIGHEP